MNNRAPEYTIKLVIVAVVMVVINKSNSCGPLQRTAISVSLSLSINDDSSCFIGAIFPCFFFASREQQLFSFLFKEVDVFYCVIELSSLPNAQHHHTTKNIKGWARSCKESPVQYISERISFILLVLIARLESHWRSRRIRLCFIQPGKAK